MPLREPTDSPDLSVVVPSVNGWPYLSETLRALHLTPDVSLDIIVPDRCGPAVREQVARTFPDVRVLPAAPDTSIPSLRAMACAAARADSIAIIEDHISVPPDWASALLAARARGDRVAGGLVVNGATSTLRDRVAFLCEYSAALQKHRAGPSAWLMGNNTVYARELLADHIAEIAQHWEDHLHASLRASGVELMLHPDIIVRHMMRFTMSEYVVQRFLYSRSFAGMRTAGRPFPARAARAAACIALPVVLLARIARRAWPDPEHRRTFIRGLPMLTIFVSAWAIGEMVGCIAGAGNALSKVR